MEKGLRTQEVIERLKKKGITISKRTIEYYQELGFLPRPIRKKGTKTGGGVLGYYQPTIVNLIEHIHKEKEKGLTLSQIANNLRTSLYEKYKQHYLKRDFSDLLPTEEYFVPKIKEELLNKLIGLTDREIEVIALTHIKRFISAEVDKNHIVSDFIQNEGQSLGLSDFNKKQDQYKLYISRQKLQLSWYKIIKELTDMPEVSDSYRSYWTPKRIKDRIKSMKKKLKTSFEKFCFDYDSSHPKDVEKDFENRKAFSIRRILLG